MGLKRIQSAKPEDTAFKTRCRQSMEEYKIFILYALTALGFVRFNGIKSTPAKRLRAPFRPNNLLRGGN